MKRTLSLFLLTLSLSMGIQAQTSKNGRQTETERIAKRAERVADNLKLDDKTKAWFLPIYTDYQTELSEINKIGRQEGQETAKKQKGEKALTDEAATLIVESGLEKAEKRAAASRKYYNLLKEQLTPQQLVTIFHTTARPDFNRQLPRPGGGRHQGTFGGMRPKGFGGNMDRESDF